MSIDSYDFLQRLYNHEVSSNELARYLANGENHYSEIKNYLYECGDLEYINRVIDEARNICIWDAKGCELLKKSPIGKVLEPDSSLFYVRKINNYSERHE